MSHSEHRIIGTILNTTDRFEANINVLSNQPVRRVEMVESKFTGKTPDILYIQSNLVRDGVLGLVNNNNVVSHELNNPVNGRYQFQILAPDGSAPAIGGGEILIHLIFYT